MLFKLDKDKDPTKKQDETIVSATTTTEPPLKKEEGNNVLKRVFQCCALNGGIFFLSIAFFEYVLMPNINKMLVLLYGNPDLSSLVWQWIEPTLIGIFSLVWILPLFVLSRVVNAIWFQDIADSAYKIRKGRPQTFPSISKLIADVLMSILVQALFIAQSWLVSLVPIKYVGRGLSIFHMCLLYSIYSFEYKWFNMGWELNRRLTYIEYNWPYFLGFGLPLAILTELPKSFILSACVFSTLFPLFIISGNEAVPKHSQLDFPIKIFFPVITVSNLIFNKSIRTPMRSSSNVISTQQQQQQYRSSSTPQSTPSSTPRSTPLPSSSTASIGSTRRSTRRT